MGASILAIGGLSAGYLQSFRLSPAAYAAATCEASDDTTLRGCLTGAASGSGSIVISLTSDITLAADLPRVLLTVSSVDLTIQGNDHSIIGAGKQGFFVESDTDDTLLVTDLTITGTYTSVTGGAFHIGGQFSSATLDQVTVRKSFAGTGGGAVYSNGPLLTVIDSVFEDDSSGATGGAVYVDGDLRLEGSILTGNEAEYYGGAVLVSNNAYVHSSYFSDNESAKSGGAVTAYTGNLTAVNSIFVNNRAQGAGGALYSAEPDNVNVSGSIFQGNRAEDGGAIYVASGSDAVFVTDSTFTGNSVDDSASHDGGALYVRSPLYISGSAFDGNAGKRGGAVYATHPVTIDGSTFESNYATEDGGAVFANGTLAVQDSTFASNDGRVRGGAVYSYGSLTVAGGTFTGNSAQKGGALYAMDVVDVANSTFVANQAVGALGEGGAIHVMGSYPADISFSTFVNNASGYVVSSDDSRGLGSALWMPYTQLSILGTVIDDSTASPLPCKVRQSLPVPVGDARVSGTLVPYTGTVDDTVVFATGWCGLTDPASDDTFVSSDFQLGALGDNGGLTDTLMPAMTSPLVTRGPTAVDLGDDTVALDQRGAVRPTSLLFTIGAVQVPGVPAPGGSNAPVGRAGDESAVVDAPTSVVGGASSWIVIAYPQTETPFLIVADDTCLIGSGVGSCTVTGLTNGVTYRFKATPSNAQGVGRVSAASNAVVPSGTPAPPGPVFVPSAPRDVRAVAGDRSAVVSWSAPASSGSFPVSNYRATSSPGGQTCLVTVTSCDVTGLSNGVTYTFTVEALNGAGWGPAGGPSNAVTPGGVTPAPEPQPLPGPLSPGESLLQVNGQPDPSVTVDPNAKDNGLRIEGDGWNMDLDGLGPDGKPLNLGPDGSLRLATERDVETSGTGFLPNSDVDLYVDPPVLLRGAMARASWATGAASSAVYVGTVRTDARGNFTGTATLPADIEPGDHVLQAVGYSPAAQARAMSLGVVVERWIVLDQGTRKADGRHDRIRTTGSTGGIDAGVRLTPHIRYTGQSGFSNGRATITVQSDGTFTWTRQIKKAKGLTAYVSYVDTDSNRVFWAKVR